MKRGLILAGVWSLGVAVALTLAFAAVGKVANGVATRDVARLTSREIDNELAGPGARPVTPSSGGPSTTTTTAASAPTTTGSPSSASSSSSTTTSTTRPTGSSIVKPTTVSTATTTTTTTVPTTTTTAAEPHNTVTTAQGGTVFSRCSAPEKIEYVAAVPKSGYERTVDVEHEDGIKQVFVNAHHRSQIEAECSGGVVQAQVDEESSDN